MKTNILRRSFALFAVYLALANWSHASVPKFETLGDNTFSATREAGNGFSRDTKSLKAEAMADATKYCTAHGKQLKVITVTEDRPFYMLGFASAKVVFKALDAGDQDLTSEPAPLPVAAPALDKPAVQGDLYTELLKLDDLRKRGILTEKEFEAEKKKVLKRSK